VLTAPPAPVGKFQILVIEDDPHIARLLRENIHKAGFDCRTESSGHMGFIAFQQGQPQLILLDLMLPDATGYEVCAKIRQTSSVPIIMLTARSELQDQLQGFKLGADDYITKPFDPKLLLARVVAHLRRVYRYDVPPPNAGHDGNGEHAVPAGWLECDGCRYMGPRNKFEDFDSQGMVIFVCPHCNHRMTHVVA
jgi:DNA-binding response OmpR family regulator